MLVKLNNQEFKVNKDEFNEVYHDKFNNLHIIPELGEQERIVSLLSELGKIINNKSIVIYGSTHGGYIPVKCSESFDRVYVYEYANLPNIEENVRTDKIMLNRDFDPSDQFIFFINEDDPFVKNESTKYDTIILSKYLDSSLKGTTYTLSKTDYKINIPEKYLEKFNTEFSFYIEGDILNYDNLIHLAMIVKNSGNDLEKMLKENLPFIDRWTILDTGSTDNTIEIINRVLKCKKGELYCEPFINFRESRNRCLDLCGSKCKYIIMLDDTYILKGDIRSFFTTIRGDQFASSLSLYVKSDDVEYVSNRIIKSSQNLRYVYKIHEVIQQENNVNVCVPITESWIDDTRSSYMQERTMSRKESDLKLLFEMVEEDPDNPRHLYYIAQTYNLLKKYDLAYKYFLLRAKNEGGFIQERVDSYFEAARIANFRLGFSWEICEDLYVKSYELDNERPDSMYFIGIHHNMVNDIDKAYEYFKKAFDLGYPINSQHSLKPTLSYHFVPKFLSTICYLKKDFKTGLKCCEYFLKNNIKESDYYDVMVSWKTIFMNLVNVAPCMSYTKPSKPILCFIADGGFNQWSGSSIVKHGVGGSETFIIEMARHIQKLGFYDVYVFCRCKEQETIECVSYMDIGGIHRFLSSTYVDTCIISRYTEYVPLCYEYNVKNIHIVLHDLMINGTVIPKDPKLKSVLCLTKWHSEYFKNMFPSLADIVKVFNYGIDSSFFHDSSYQKDPYRFIYSSFPNRGLVQLLTMWPKIKSHFPVANLHLYFDIENKWVNNNCPEIMNEVRRLLILSKNLDVYYHGWVDKYTLSKAWEKSEIWLYPCVFNETFCLTSLEAAASRTLSISTNLAALSETNQGIIIEGDPNSDEWVDKVIDVLKTADKKAIAERCYDWAKTLTWERRATVLSFILQCQDHC